MSSITFAPVCIASNRRKDGTYPVRIRVTYKGASRRLATNMVARPADLTRSLHLKSPDLLNKSQALISEMRAAVSGLSPFLLEGWDVDRVVAHIRATLAGEHFRLDFFQYADKLLTGKTAQTRRVYDTALNSFADWLGRRELDINEITKRMLTAWKESVDARGKLAHGKDTGRPQRGGQGARHIARLAHIYKTAQAEYNDDERTLIPRSPFDGIPRALPIPDGARAFTADEIRMLIRADVSGDERVAIDAALLSFCLMGVNLADLWDAKPQGAVWVYNRRKTEKRRQDRARMELDIPPEAEPYIARLRGRGPYWLNVLHGFGTRKDKRDGCIGKINAALRRWAEREGLPDVPHIKYYSARKAWATIARSREVAVEKALVDECLTHKGEFPVTDIYAARDYGAMNAANRRVLDYINFSESAI